MVHTTHALENSLMISFASGEPRPAGAILLGILMSLCLALVLLLMDIVRRAVVDAIKAHVNG